MSDTEHESVHAGSRDFEAAGESGLGGKVVNGLEQTEGGAKLTSSALEPPFPEHDGPDVRTRTLRSLREFGTQEEGEREPAGSVFPPESIDYGRRPLPGLSSGLPERVQFMGASARLDVSEASFEGGKNVGETDPNSGDLWDVWRTSSLSEIQEQLSRGQVIPEKHVLNDSQFELLRSVCRDPMVMDNLSVIWAEEKVVLAGALSILHNRMERTLQRRIEQQMAPVQGQLDRSRRESEVRQDQFSAKYHSVLKDHSVAIEEWKVRVDKEVREKGIVSENLAEANDRYRTVAQRNRELSQQVTDQEMELEARERELKLCLSRLETQGAQLSAYATTSTPLDLQPAEARPDPNKPLPRPRRKAGRHVIPDSVRGFVDEARPSVARGRTMGLPEYDVVDPVTYQPMSTVGEGGLDLHESYEPARGMRATTSVRPRDEEIRRPVDEGVYESRGIGAGERVGAQAPGPAPPLGSSGDREEESERRYTQEGLMQMQLIKSLSGSLITYQEKTDQKLLEIARAVASKSDGAATGAIGQVGQVSSGNPLTGTFPVSSSQILSTTVPAPSLSSVAPGSGSGLDVASLAYQSSQMKEMERGIGDFVGAKDIRYTWAAYLRKFSRQALSRNLTKESKACVLARKLGGDAETALEDLSVSEMGDFDKLVEALNAYFAPLQNRTINRDALNNRKQGAGESPADFSRAVRLLAEGAFPGDDVASKERRQEESLRVFLNGIDDGMQRVYLYDREFTKLNDAVLAAERWLTYARAGTGGSLSAADGLVLAQQNVDGQQTSRSRYTVPRPSQDGNAGTAPSASSMYNSPPESRLAPASKSVAVEESSNSGPHSGAYQSGYGPPRPQYGAGRGYYSRGGGYTSRGYGRGYGRGYYRQKQDARMMDMMEVILKSHPQVRHEMQAAGFGEDMVCWGCGQPGHFQRDCPHRPWRQESSESRVRDSDVAAVAVEHPSTQVSSVDMSQSSSAL